MRRTRAHFSIQFLPFVDWFAHRFEACDSLWPTRVRTTNRCRSNERADPLYRRFVVFVPPKLIFRVLKRFFLFVFYFSRAHVSPSVDFSPFFFSPVSKQMFSKSDELKSNQTENSAQLPNILSLSVFDSVFHQFLFCNRFVTIPAKNRSHQMKCNRDLFDHFVSQTHGMK